MFQEVVCVTLQRRSDRWHAFLNRLNELSWPFRAPSLFTAIDGKLCNAPPWWKMGNGAWGCYRSHLAIIESCLNRGVESVLILEDDAVPVIDFAKRWNELYAPLIPEDWEQLYLGGQHLGGVIPHRVNEGWAIPHNVNRTHAYALNRAGMLKVYKHISDTQTWKVRNHIDHRLGQLAREKKIKVYSTNGWFIGQDGGQSDVAYNEFPQRFWNPSERIPAEERDTQAEDPCEPFVAVIGLHRSGSSCFAGVLHHLGVHMGNKFTGCEPDGGFEAKDLARLCENAMKFPTTLLQLSEARIIDRLKAFVVARTEEAKTIGTIAGGKYPHLCTLGKYLPKACDNGFKLIHINRPLEQSIASLIRREPKRDPAQLRKLQTFLWDEKIALLAEHPHLTVEYEELLDNPEREIERVCNYLSIRPRNPKTAAQYVKPSLRHIS